MTECSCSWTMPWWSILSKLDIPKWPRYSRTRSKKGPSKGSSRREVRRKIRQLKVHKRYFFWFSKILTRGTRVNFSKRLMHLCLLRWRKEITLTKSWNSFYRFTLWCTLDIPISTQRISLKKLLKESFQRLNPNLRIISTLKVLSFRKQTSSWLTMLCHTFQIHPSTLHLSTFTLLSGFKISSKSWNLLFKITQLDLAWFSLEFLPSSMEFSKIFHRLWIQRGLSKVRALVTDSSLCKRIWLYSRRKRHIVRRCFMKVSSSGLTSPMTLLEIAKS